MERLAQVSATCVCLVHMSSWWPSLPRLSCPLVCVRPAEFIAWWTERLEAYKVEKVLPHLLHGQGLDMIDPNGAFRQTWDIVQALLLVYIAIFVPWRICFNVDIEMWSATFLWEIFVDIYFWTDLVINFRTGECRAGP